jgi:hypothetical protein
MLMVGGVLIASFFAAAPGIGGFLLSLLMPYAITYQPYRIYRLDHRRGHGRRHGDDLHLRADRRARWRRLASHGARRLSDGQAREANRAFGAATMGSMVVL